MKKKIFSIFGILFAVLSTLNLGGLTVKAETANIVRQQLGIYFNVAGSTNGFDEVARITVNGRQAICVEPFVDLFDNVTATSEIAPSNLKYINALGKAAEELGAKTDNNVLAAYQWSAWSRLIGSSGISYLSGGDLAKIQSAKAQIESIADKLTTLPNFGNTDYTVKMGQPLTIEDKNGVLDYWNISNNSGNLDIVKSGNKVTISVNKDSKDGKQTLKFRQKQLIPAQAMIWKSTAFGNPNQTLFTAGEDPFNDELTLNLNVIKTGKAQVQKLDEETGNPMANVQFKMTVDGKDYDVTTNDKGIGFLDKEFLDGTEVTYTEVKTLEGYVLNETPLKNKIVGGETITLSMNNETQKGRVKGHKDKEVYNASESEKQGKSVYDKVSLSNVTFDVVAQNDITRPDGEIVLKKGEAADTFTTNENGDFESTKDIYIGSQNTYKLVERDVPENYRPLYDNQATFTIPYDSTNKTKVFTLDMGTLDNDLKTGTFKLEKVDSETGKVIPNTQFLLRGLSTYNKDVLYTITTGDSATIDKLIAGKYEVVEVKYSDGYTQNESETLTKIIEIKDGETTQVTIKNNKIDVKQPKTTIKTKAHLADGSQELTYGDVVEMYDDVVITHEDILDGTARAFETILVARTPDGKESDIWKSGKIDYKVSDSQFAKTVVTEKVDTGAYPKGTTFYFKEIGYDKDGNKDTEHNFDGKDQEQGIYPKETPESSLPTTNESSNIVLVGGGILLLAVVTGAFLLKKKYHNNKSIS